MAKEDERNNANESKILTFADFLMTIPPYTSAKINDLCSWSGNYAEMNEPTLTLYCDSDICNGERYFDCNETWGSLKRGEYKPINLFYLCRHCRKGFKWFAILAFTAYSDPCKMIKFGEVPSFGPHIPSRVISLIGPDRDIFLKGRRAESNGLGIGAFTYYRRVIENQWQRLIDEIIRVAEKLNLPKDVLLQAKSENQFSKAVEMVKDTVPQALLVEGHNPLTLLHKNLSVGIHELSDEECLELAQSIRLVLSDFSEKINEVLKERAELKGALSRLFGLKSKKKIQEKKNLEENTEENKEE